MILTTPQFAKEIKKLSKKFKSIKKDLSQLIERLEENPTEGTSLGNGCYKIRVANSSILTGKSGLDNGVHHSSLKRRKISVSLSGRELNNSRINSHIGMFLS